MFGNSLLKKILDLLKTTNENYAFAHNKKVQQLETKFNEISAKLDNIDRISDQIHLELIKINCNLEVKSNNKIEQKLDKISYKLDELDENGFGREDSRNLSNISSELSRIYLSLLNIENKD